MEEKEVFAAVNLELNRVFRVNYKLPNNPQNYSWLCIESKKPLFYNRNYTVQMILVQKELIIA